MTTIDLSTDIYFRNINIINDWEYSTTSDFSSTIIVRNCPITLINNTQLNINVFFTNNLVVYASTHFFIMGSNNITIDGQNNVVEIMGVIGYPGLVQNGTSSINGYNNIVIQNLGVTATNGSSLAPFGGWIGHRNMNNNVGSTCFVTNCYSSGLISGVFVGGIFGGFSGGTATNCYSSGPISGAESGGIFGGFSRGTATNCYSEGAISGFFAGGIYGRSSSGTAANCYSSGNILGADAGGIFGGASTGAATNCYSRGPISGSWVGGIFGGFSIGAATNCYSEGAISGFQSGGIFGDSSGGTATNCYSSGPINGVFAGGIYGANSRGTATNCYSSGSISGQRTGGIFGPSANSIRAIAANCYSSGSISGLQSGGIFGPIFNIINNSWQVSTNQGINCNFSNGIWLDNDATVVLLGAPTYSPTFSQGTIWVDINLLSSNIPWRLRSFITLPTGGSFETSGLVGSTTTISLQGQSNDVGALIYEITKYPQFGSLTTTNINGVYAYVPNTNITDSFEYIVREDTITSFARTVIIYNYSESDISNIPRTLGTLEVNNILFDGNQWTFGTIKTDTFIQGLSFYTLGTMTLNDEAPAPV